MAWILSLLAGVLGSSFAVVVPLSVAAFLGTYSSRHFRMDRMDPVAILFFPVSCMTLLYLGRFMIA